MDSDQNSAAPFWKHPESRRLEFKETFPKGNQLARTVVALCSWDAGYVKVRNTFSRQAIPMTWDFAEANPFSDSTGNFLGAANWVAGVIQKSPARAGGKAGQLDAGSAIGAFNGSAISTDPPYYDNIGYADLSDFFYVWLRHSIGKVYPDLFSTMQVPKAEELVATPYRFDGNKEEESSLPFRYIRKSSEKGLPLYDNRTCRR